MSTFLETHPAVVPASVLLSQAISHTARRLYIIMLSVADNAPICQESNRTLASLMGCARQTIPRLLRELQAKGFVWVEFPDSDETSPDFDGDHGVLRFIFLLHLENRTLF